MLISDDMLGYVTFVRELIMITEGFLDLCNGLVLSTDEVKNIIFYMYARANWMFILFYLIIRC